MRNFPILLAFGLLALGCKSNDSTTKAAGMNQKIEPPKWRTILVDSEAANRKMPTDFTVSQWEVSGDTLLVDVQYSGGCKSHDWKMYFSGAMMKSLPPQALLQLEHINLESDPCRSVVREKLKFNLSSLRQGAKGKVVVKWAGDTAKAATYAF